MARSRGRGGRGVVWLLLAALVGRDAAPIAFAQDGSILAPTNLEEGRRLYREGEYDLAAESLEAARAAEPSDPRAALFLGLTEIRRSRPGDAVENLADFVALDSGSDEAVEIGRLLPIVEREAYAREARAALSAEAIGGEPPLAEGLVAVLPFAEGGGGDAAPLSRAIAVLVSKNLASVAPDGVVPPEKVFSFMEEAKVSPQGLAGPAAAARIGRLLGAGRVVAGTLSTTADEPKRLRADVQVLRSKDASKLDSVGVERLAADGAALVAPVAEGVALALGVTIPPAAEGLRQEHTRSLEAFRAFGRGLDGIEAGEAMDARLELERALAADSSFVAARERLERTPASFVSLVAVGNMIESAALSPAERGETGMSTGTWLLLGAGAVAAGAAGIAFGLGGGGGGGGGGDDGDPQAPILEGVSDRTVIAGDQVSLFVAGRDPDGGEVTLTADLSDVPGATFESTPGNPATGTFRWRPTLNDLGVQRLVITVTESGQNPLSTSDTALITVIAGAITPTMTPEPTPTPEGPPPTPTPSMP